MTPPPVCPRCASDRVGVMDDRATYACGTVFFNDRLGWAVREPAKCQSGLMEITNVIPTHVDILHEVKRDAWKRGAEAMKSSVMDLVEGRGDVLVDTEVRIAALEIPPYADA